MSRTFLGSTKHIIAWESFSALDGLRMVTMTPGKCRGMNCGDDSDGGDDDDGGALQRALEEDSELAGYAGVQRLVAKQRALRTKERGNAAFAGKRCAKPEPSPRPPLPRLPGAVSVPRSPVRLLNLAAREWKLKVMETGERWGEGTHDQIASCRDRRVLAVLEIRSRVSDITRSGKQRRESNGQGQPIGNNTVVPTLPIFQRAPSSGFTPPLCALGTKKRRMRSRSAFRSTPSASCTTAIAPPPVQP